MAHLRQGAGVGPTCTHHIKGDLRGYRGFKVPTLPIAHAWLWPPFASFKQRCSVKGKGATSSVTNPPRRHRGLKCRHCRHLVGPQLHHARLARGDDGDFGGGGHKGHLHPMRLRHVQRLSFSVAHGGLLGPHRRGRHRRPERHGPAGVRVRLADSVRSVRESCRRRGRPVRRGPEGGQYHDEGMAAADAGAAPQSTAR